MLESNEEYFRNTFLSVLAVSAKSRAKMSPKQQKQIRGKPHVSKIFLFFKIVFISHDHSYFTVKSFTHKLCNLI